MQRRVVLMVLAGAGFSSVMAACGPIETRNTVVIQQPKPLEVNVNLTGKLELVITDARKDLETITGEKAKREVRPEDIGLPATGSPGSMLPPEEGLPVALLTNFSGAGAGGGGVYFVAATEEGVLASLKARHAAVRQLLSAKVVGEAHTGLLAEKGTMSAEQSATMAAENADRAALYELRTAKNNTTVAAAALAYYLQRLGYVEKGDWVEVYDKAGKVWEWKQWDK